MGKSPILVQCLSSLKEQKKPRQLKMADEPALGRSHGPDFSGYLTKRSECLCVEGRAVGTPVVAVGAPSVPCVLCFLANPAAALGGVFQGCTGMLWVRQRYGWDQRIVCCSMRRVSREFVRSMACAAAVCARPGAANASGTLQGQLPAVSALFSPLWTPPSYSPMAALYSRSPPPAHTSLPIPTPCCSVWKGGCARVTGCLRTSPPLFTALS